MADQESIKMQASNSFEEQLKIIQNQNQKVTVTLKSGTTFTGGIADLSATKLVLTKLAEKDYFDAMINLDDIVALELRVVFP